MDTCFTHFLWFMCVGVKRWYVVYGYPSHVMGIIVMGIEIPIDGLMTISQCKYVVYITRFHFGDHSR